MKIKIKFVIDTDVAANHQVILNNEQVDQMETIQIQVGFIFSNVDIFEDRFDLFEDIVQRPQTEIIIPSIEIISPTRTNSYVE
jgi:ABC-type uncharacterized transport system YnjBCD ATPase subunit